MKDLMKLKQITRHFVNKANKIQGNDIKSCISAIDCITECIEKVDRFAKDRLTSKGEL
jgi:hypothetical protein